MWKNTAEQDKFLEAMAESAKSVIDYLDNEIVYINMVCNLSVDCDCCAVAEDPCMSDIGILASTDPVSLDKACLDLVYSSNDSGKAHFIERVESRHGTHTIDHAELVGCGSKNYELIQIN